MRLRLGGTPLTPVPLKAPNSVQFWSLSDGDFAAAAIQQLAGAPAVCNANHLVNQIKGDEITQPSSSDWIDTNAK